jgi:hypothetical protein
MKARHPVVVAVTTFSKMTVHQKIGAKQSPIMALCHPQYAIIMTSEKFNALKGICP